MMSKTVDCGENPNLKLNHGCTLFFNVPTSCVQTLLFYGISLHIGSCLAIKVVKGTKQLLNSNITTNHGTLPSILHQSR